MQVLYPNDLKARKLERTRRQRSRRRKQFGVRLSSLLVALVVLIGGLAVFSISRPVSAIQPSLIARESQSVAPLSLPWPKDGQAAIGAVGYGVLDQHNSDKAVPTASTAKIFTALMIMKVKPLQPDQQGPLITITAQDEAIYQKYIAEEGSVYPVTAGQQISEFEALRALLLPSANNIADMLATWAYGSMDAYLTAANQELKNMGMTNTTLADASGFVPQTVSTAHDLTLAGELLMQNPVLAKIVGTQNFEIPGLGTVHNTNVLLGSGGVVGIKTGHTDEAGGCFVIAVTSKLDEQHEVTVVSAVLGAADVASAMKSSLQLSNDTKLGFATQTIVTKNQSVAQYRSGWGETVNAIASDDLRGVAWLPGQIVATTSLATIRIGAPAGSQVGTVSADFGKDIVSVPVHVQTAIKSPPLSWRLYKRYI